MTVRVTPTGEEEDAVVLGKEGCDRVSFEGARYGDSAFNGPCFRRSARTEEADMKRNTVGETVSGRVLASVPVMGLIHTPPSEPSLMDARRI